MSAAVFVVVAIGDGDGGAVIVAVGSLGGKTRRDNGKTRSNTHAELTFIPSRSFLNSRNNFFSAR